MSDPIVATSSGKISGLQRDGVTVFLAVPYAAPPVGERRFAAPALHETWEDVRDATQAGPSAPHAMRPFEALDVTPLVGEGWRRGDDFLTVNIWTAQAGVPETGAKGRPVMVFIHGGAFVAGRGETDVQDGSAFARAGVVLMTINYRLGVEGFLPIAGAPTNLGLRDQIAALEWARDNAAAFGGDPANVTVFGESAGAMSIADLIASPRAKGLFRRAIVQSGHGSMVRPIAVAERLTRRLARMLRIAPNVEGFRSASVERCLEAVDRVQQPTARINLRDSQGREPAFGLSRFLPVYGDDVLPERPLDALAKGAGADVDLLIGTNAEEMNLYFVPTGVTAKIGALLAWFTLSRSQPKARAVLKAYGMGRKERRPGEALAAAMNDLVFRLPARRFAAAHQGRTHVYEFGWRSPAFDGQLGACHALEVPFVFNTLACCSGPKGFVGEAPPQALADTVQAIWIGFARDGSLPWPEYEGEAPPVYRLDEGRTVIEPEMPAARHQP